MTQKQKLLPSVHLDQEAHQKLKVFSAKVRKPMKDIMSEAIDKYINENTAMAETNTMDSARSV